ncbi:MAG TPA: septum formation initiator family protein [Bacteroidia bacterium]|nr:septum formation initiator family protein [Bacteroidia bacterium]
MGKKIFSVLKNKYVLTVLALAAWLLFFDRNDLFSQYERHEQVKKLENEVNYFRSEIEEDKREMKELQSDPKLLEKFAREHYLMKRDSEDIYLIVKDTLR